MIRKIKWLLTISTVVLFAFISANSGIAFASNNRELLFEQPSTQFSLDLAKLSLALSSAAYGDTSATIEKLLTSYGFTNDSIYDKDSYQKSSARDTDLAGYSFAHKTIQCGDRDFTLIAVVVRGTSGESEWISNFNINNSGSSPDVHEGFQKAEKALLSDLNAYVQALHCSPSSTKFLITGHSRGAAVANLLAAELSEGETLAPRTNIYGYTFATPNVAKIDPERYDLNIFNAVNPADIVTEIPLETWGYGKYGVTYSLPEKGQIDAADLASNQKVLIQFASMAPTVEDFNKIKPSFLSERAALIPTGDSSTHAPEVYMHQLDQINPEQLSKKIFDLQLELLPDTNYA
ncbi:lipase family protein [Aminipila luticellarii]|uniref:Lipase family protein n=1 Tax=Aminipila luticellarii TaxID=2507160 RepID=A0A410PS45_9FIRM|nr:lipase family protein [Aminipila luticellarii]QAT41811.1 lipase family protein [Aminipila luticellarii]